MVSIRKRWRCWVWVHDWTVSERVLPPWPVFRMTCSRCGAERVVAF